MDEHTITTWSLSDFTEDELNDTSTLHYWESPDVWDSGRIAPPLKQRVPSQETAVTTQQQTNQPTNI